MQDANFDPVPAPSRPRVWGLKDTAIVAAIVIAAFVVIPSILIVPADLIWGEDSEGYNVAAAIGTMIWYIVVVLIVFRYVQSCGFPPRALGLHWPTGGRDSWGRLIGLGLLTFLAMQLVVYGYSIVAFELFDLDFLEPSDQIEDSLFDQDVALVFLGFAVVIGAPITEELFFRGFLFGGIRHYVPLVLSALLTGLVFSLLHFNIGLIIPFTVIGALLALSYQRAGNLITPISAHFLFNLVSFLALVFIPGARDT